MNTLPHRLRMFHRLRCAGAAMLVLAATAGLNAGAGNPLPRTPLVVVSDDNYPPYIFRGADGRLQGIIPDQWALWQQKTGVRVELRAMDWAEAQQVMQAGHADVIDTIFRTPEREQIYSFTPPYATIKVPVFAHKTLGGITDVASLQGFTIGVKAGDAVLGHLTNRGIESLEEFPSYEAIIQAAKQEKLKVFSVDQPAAIYYLYKYGIANDYNQSFVLYTGEFHRAVWKNRPDLLALVNNGFAKISRGEYRAIDRKWMGSPFLIREIIHDWLPVLVLIAGIILLLAVGNLVLQHRVHQRTTELRQALADLHNSQNRLQSILKSAPIGIGVLGNRRILEANDMLCRMTGYAPDEIVGKSTRELYPNNEEYERVGRELYGQVADNGYGFMEVDGRTKDGQVMRWLIGGAPLNPERPDEGLIITARDITERKKSEEALRISREYFASVFDAVNDGLMIHDPATGKLLDVNRRLCEMSGYTREEALASGVAPMCAGFPPYTVENLKEWNRRACAEGPLTCEFLAKHRDGQLLWVEVALRQVRIGPDLRLIAAVRDIRERKVAEEEHRRYEQRLQDAQKLESLGLLAGGIAHDFNNLLAAILGNLDLALLSIPQDSGAHADVKAAMDATKRAADLVQQLLAYAGQGRIVAKPLDIPAAIRETVALLQAALPGNVHLDLALPDGLPCIPADAIQFHQVVMNLLINAAEAFESAPGRIRISAGMAEAGDLPTRQMWPATALPPGPCLYIEIADTGKGIPPDVLSKVFDPFFSTKFTGRGLGLPAVLGIVRRHHGAIHVDSVPGKGSTFRVYLPMNPPPAAPKEENPDLAGQARNHS